MESKKENYNIRARGHVVLVMFAQVKGDGACFVHALSVHLFGNEELHVQIRLFIVATSFLSRVAYFSGSGNVQVHSLARFICCLRTSICSSLSHIPCGCGLTYVYQLVVVISFNPSFHPP